MKEVTRVVREFLILAAVGVSIGLIANALNPNGLSLSRNYFAKPIVNTGSTRPHGGPGTNHRTQPSPASQAADSPLISSGGGGDTGGHNTTKTSQDPSEHMTEDEMVQRLRELGFQALYHHEVVDIFNSPYRADGLYVIIDARTEQHYRSGHIPGAYHLDHYYLDRTIGKVLEVCKTADKIVIYCNGGACEDSELAVGDLLERDIPFDRLYIYAGGFTMWAADGMQYEVGERNSGELAWDVPASGEQASEGAAK
ncbi:MAG: rhodanese-like domain-containing protein [Phycisphaerae bacterium]